MAKGRQERHDAIARELKNAMARLQYFIDQNFAEGMPADREVVWDFVCKPMGGYVDDVLALLDQMTETFGHHPRYEKFLYPNGKPDLTK
jgi:hypothetical protein